MFVTPMQLKMKFTSCAIARNISNFEMNFSLKYKVISIILIKQLSYSDLVIKLMNSEDIYLNLRLMNYISLLNNLRDSILSSKNDVT